MSSRTAIAPGSPEAPGERCLHRMVTIGLGGTREAMHTIHVDDKVRFYLNSAGNDLWIRECVFPGKQGGYFVEAGAADGISNSSCYLLERSSDGAASVLNRIRRSSSGWPVRVRTAPEKFACLSSMTGIVSFLEGEETSADAYHSGVTAHLKRFKDKSEGILDRGAEVPRRALTLEELLQKHNAPAHIDYAAFDMEGSEFEVLRDFPFSKYTFGAISLECDGKIWESITELLSRNGYREVRNPFNVNEPWERYWLHQSTPAPRIPQIGPGPDRHKAS